MYTDFTNNIQSFRLYPILSDYHNQVHLNDTGGYLVRVDIGEGVFVYVRLSIYPLIIVTSYQSEHNGSA